MRVILASASPRRLELLRYAIKEFEVSPAAVDESLPDYIAAEAAAEFLAVKKAGFIAGANPECLVIGCDTVVISDGIILGKPADYNDAVQMLTKLSGKTHTVITGVCFFYRGKSMSFSESTSVQFYPLSGDDIKNYAGTGEPFDKAGAYGIQGCGCMLVKRIDGDFNNVVGLPVSRLKRELDIFLKMQF